jgi:hypothetical protein
MVEWVSAIHQDTSTASGFIIDVLLASGSFLELLVIAGLASSLREEEWTTIELGMIAIGMSVAVGGVRAIRKNRWFLLYALSGTAAMPP